MSPLHRIIVLTCAVLFSCSLPTNVFAGSELVNEILRLRKDLLSEELSVMCDAAKDLGEIKDAESIEPLAKRVENNNPQIRKCAIEGLRLYGDPGFCQDFYTIWLSDNDIAVRKAAGISVLANSCDQYIERKTEYLMDSKTCGYTQFFVNSIRDAILAKNGSDGWQKSIIEMNIKETIRDEDTPEEIMNMRLNLVFAAMDWGETAVLIRDYSDLGDVEINRKEYISYIESYSIKEEYIKQFCPQTLFPDYSVWNSLLRKNAIK